MNHLVFALTAPADRAVFDRISAAYADFPAWVETLREKKIDVAHEVASWDRLRAMEALLQHREVLSGAKDGTPVADDHYQAIRAQRIYFRVLLLNLLNQEDAWEDEQARKAAEKKVRA